MGQLKDENIMRILLVSAFALACAVSASARLEAQEPLPAGTPSAVEGTIGNSVMQLRYLGPSPMAQARSDLDYGLLLSEDRDVIGSAALLFRTDLNLIPRLTFQIGPQGYLALLAAQQKTDVAALALGGSARYELIPRLGLAVFGSAFYSPGVITFGNAHNLYDFSAGAEVHFTRQLTGLGGYRWVKFTLVNEPDDIVADEAFAGLRWAFE